MTMFQKNSKADCGGKVQVEEEEGVDLLQETGG